MNSAPQSGSLVIDDTSIPLTQPSASIYFNFNPRRLNMPLATSVDPQAQSDRQASGRGPVHHTSATYRPDRGGADRICQETVTMPAQVTTATTLCVEMLDLEHLLDAAANVRAQVP